MDRTFVLAAELDPESFVWLDALRREHFPVERNLLPAHATMLHRLSSAQRESLDAFEMPTGPLPVLFEAPVLLGFGVAIRIRSPELERFRERIRAVLADGLSRQDARPWRPHVTIQNKATADAAKRLHLALSDGYGTRRERLPVADVGILGRAVAAMFAEVFRPTMTP